MRNVIVVVAALVTLTGCGGTSAPAATHNHPAKPSVAVLEAAIIRHSSGSTKYTPKQAACLARLFDASPLSYRDRWGIAAHGLVGFSNFTDRWGPIEVPFGDLAGIQVEVLAINAERCVGSPSLPR